MWSSLIRRSVLALSVGVVFGAGCGGDEDNSSIGPDEGMASPGGDLNSDPGSATTGGTETEGSRGGGGASEPESLTLYGVWSNAGVFFELQSDVDDSYRDLYFLDSRGTEGSGVSTALTMGSDGRIYGYTKEEGKNSNGTIFAFEPKEDSSSELEVLYDYTDRFLSRSDVPYPLVEQAGSLYQVYLARAETGTDRRIQVLELDLDTGQVNFPTQSIVGASTEVSGFTMLDDELYLVFDNEIRSYDPASPAGFSLRTTIALTPEPSTGLTGPYRYNPKWTPVAAGSKLCVVMERSHPELAQPEYVMVAYDTIEDRVTTTSLGSAAPTEQVQTDGDSVFVLVGRALQRYDVEQPGVSSVYTFGDARADIGMFAASDGNLYGTTRLVDPQRDDIYRYAPGPDRLQQLHRTTNSIQLGRGGLVEAR